MYEDIKMWGASLQESYDAEVLAKTDLQEWDDTHIPRGRVGHHETSVPKKYWVAVGDDILINNWSEFVNSSLQLKPVAHNAAPSFTTQDPLKAKELAKRTVAKYPSKYVFLGCDDTSRGVMTGKNHLRASVKYYFDPKTKMWSDAFMESEELDEADMAVVDDQYISRAAELLGELAVKDEDAYDVAMAKLKRFRGKKLVSPEQFAMNLLQNAGIAEKPSARAQTRDELMDKAAAGNKAMAPKYEPKEQTVKSIWVKDIWIDDADDMNSVAKLQLEYVDGKTEDVDFSVGTTQDKGGFDNSDKLYKELKRLFPKAGDKDIRLAMVRVAFNDWRILWKYGPSKETDRAWSFAEKVDKAGKSPFIKRVKKSWLDKSGNKAVVYKSGSTTIYKNESVCEGFDVDYSDIGRSMELELETPGGDTSIVLDGDEDTNELVLNWLRNAIESDSSYKSVSLYVK